MRAKYKIWGISILIVMGVLLAACGISAEESSSPLPLTQAASQTVAQPSTPTSLPSPTRTPAPTARPLLEDMNEEGVYRHSTLGVSFEYPENWDVEVEYDNSLENVTIIHNELPALIYLTMNYVAEGEDVEVLAEEFFEWLQLSLDLSSVTRTTIDPDYKLAGGTDAWRGIGEGVFSGVSDPLTFESIAVRRGNLVFQLVTMGRFELDASIELILEDVRQSFMVFSPSPYGVIREEALFLAGSEPTTLDPAKSHGGPDSIIGDLFSGLIKLNTDLQVIP